MLPTVRGADNTSRYWESCGPVWRVEWRFEAWSASLLRFCCLEIDTFCHHGDFSHLAKRGALACSVHIEAGPVSFRGGFVLRSS